MSIFIYVCVCVCLYIDTYICILNLYVYDFLKRQPTLKTTCKMAVEMTFEKIRLTKHLKIGAAFQANPYAGVANK